MYTDEEKRKVAYALNLWTVSVSQIVDYNDAQIMDQEYNNILNNLNLENMPKDDSLLEVINNILDVITSYRIDAGDRNVVEKEYQHRMKNAIWTAVPNVGAIFLSTNPVSMALTLATQVGTGYMNYRKNKAEYSLNREKSLWELNKNLIYQLNGLQKKLFEAAWKLADTYEFKDYLRLTEQQIHEYNEILIIQDPIRRYNSLDAIRGQFDAYPPFWYQMGSAANTVYRENSSEADKEFAAVYKQRAIDCFQHYRSFQDIDLLRHDAVASSCALEYLDLLDFEDASLKDKALIHSLISDAETYSGSANDVLELCAFAHLKNKDYENATKLLKRLVNKDYNISVNTQILSALYIRAMHSGDSERVRQANVGYKELQKTVDSQFILQIPSNFDDDAKELPWITDNEVSPIEEYAQQKAAEEAAYQESQKRTHQQDEALNFYKCATVIVHDDKAEDRKLAEFMLSFLNEQKNNLTNAVPAPTRITIKEYTQRQAEIDSSNQRVLFIGDSKEAQIVYDNARNKKWDFDKFGIKFVTHGMKTVILVSRLKNGQLDEFIDFAKRIGETVSVDVPDNVKGVKYESFFNETIVDSFVHGDRVTTVLAGIIASPLIVFGETISVVEAASQRFSNLSQTKKLRALQYIVAFVEYLKRNNGIVAQSYQNT